MCAVKRGEACLLAPVLAALPPAFVYNFFSQSQYLDGRSLTDEGPEVQNVSSLQLGRGQYIPQHGMGGIVLSIMNNSLECGCTQVQ